jgi:hypothetical protein
MSVMKVVTASGDLVIPVQAIIYGISISTTVDTTGAGMSGLGTVNVFNAATQSDGTVSNAIVQYAFFLDPNQNPADNFQYVFPAGVKCLNGGSVTITLAGAATCSVHIDYS